MVTAPNPTKKAGTLLLFFMVWAFIFLTQGECGQTRKEKVLVLHSYHQGLEWTDNITQGIQSVFSPLHKQYEVYYQYLDTKRNSGEAYKKQMALLIQARNRQVKYEVVIVADNNALDLVNKGQVRFWQAPPVVFCGINYYQPELTNNIQKVTGVVEATDHKSTIDLMLKIHPARRRIIVVLDNTVTGQSIRKELRAIEPDYAGICDFKFLRSFSLEEIPDIVGRLGQNDLIYILTFNRDKHNNFISYAEGIEMVATHTHVPIYGAWDFYLNKGIIGGRITSGFLQGKTAGELALKILQGEAPHDLDIVTDNIYQYIFDYNYLKKYNIKKSMLPSGSRIINAPPTLFEQYRHAFFTISLLPFVICGVVLYKYIRQNSLLKARKALTKELEQQVNERTEKLKAANKKLRRLSNIDSLTQLYNRRYFDKGLEAEIKRLRRSTSPLSLLICDIDYFKRYNDAYGHLAGDDCIRSVAESIRTSCKRSSDIAARYGGEEFGVILPYADPLTAQDVAELIRRTVEAKKISHKASPISSTLTISIGGTSIIPGARTTPADYICQADKALYESKTRGRNQVTLLPPPKSRKPSLPGNCHADLPPGTGTPV
nr:ABC transporter substrate binding protein [uncultured Desulfobacter sp.]